MKKIWLCAQTSMRKKLNTFKEMNAQIQPSASMAKHIHLYIRWGLSTQVKMECENCVSFISHCLNYAEILWIKRQSQPVT